MNKQMAVLTGGVGAFSLVFLGGLMSSHTLCACISLENSLRYSIGVSPRSDPEAFSERLLKILPPGSTTDMIYPALNLASRGHKFEKQSLADKIREQEKYLGKPENIENRERYLKDIARVKRRCVPGSGEIKCHFVLEKQWFNFNEIGFDLHVTLDGTDRIKDVRAVPYSVWGSGGT